ncbi:uncharacterized protein SPPG_04611 [Spizellomyces punctatus DAOM BR117]|uniref:AB hydrolase-1 domain-containing protein n=1 Tax=Spizellomyces punctatus (strain DAOM BR117) TaxID=645134 RepID=A0A0L0HGS6_SPIPD|nr:uncharacterized protein SPPG_04611 [Spizellomyces punctatus DAOM BR117]KND00282.1 hypothetical protein SPPG_04611 [Spizellomyces punctatus DAOM BR117]|eukprot:XP_016608321.1 hypothetical protein SPPG_04611 [Spizellomyces punctatus DAOM BR117]
MAIPDIPGRINGRAIGRHLVAYVTPLASRLGLENNGYSFVQPILSSSYHGYGTSSLQSDSDQIDLLVDYLRERRGKMRIVLIGHSTGAQDVIWFLHHGRLRKQVHAGILQGPVSDNEYALWMDPDGTQRWLQIAEALIADGKDQALMPREADPAPITAYRYRSLYGPNGDDDMFTSTMGAERWDRLYAPIECPLLIYLSGQDEYVPPFVDLHALHKRFVKSRNNPLDCCILDAQANHAIEDPVERDRFCTAVESFLSSLSS